jgi:hypothetical protein
MKGFYVSAYAERVIAVEVTKLATELKAASVMNISHMSLSISLIHAFVRTESAGKLRATRIHLAAELYMFLQQIF